MAGCWHCQPECFRALVQIQVEAMAGICNYLFIIIHVFKFIICYKYVFVGCFGLY